MLRLYDLPISSYGCKIRILLRHKNLRWHSVAPPDGYGSNIYRKIVPSGTIPALDDDGFIVFESEAIAEYINEIKPTPAMLPDDAQGRARARALSRFHDSRVEPVLRAFFGQVAPKNRDPDFIRDNAHLLQIRLQQLAEIARPDPFLCGDSLSLTDCGFPPSFAILCCVQAILDFTIKMPECLSAYERVLANHPSVHEELTNYYDALDRWAEEKLNS